MAHAARKKSTQNGHNRRVSNGHHKAKRPALLLGYVVAAATMLVLATESPAQPPGGPGRGGPRQQGGPGGPNGPEGPPRGDNGRNRDGGPQGMQGRPPMPMMEALDADSNGEISAAEIANASEALKTLDENSDGKLSIDEIRPKFGGRHSGDRRAAGGERRSAGGERNAESFAQRLMGRDRDGDGQLNKEEVPKRMQEHFDAIDEDQSGSISLAELESHRPARGPEAGGRRERPDRSGRPDGNRGQRGRGPGGPPADSSGLESL